MPTKTLERPFVGRVPSRGAPTKCANNYVAEEKSRTNNHLRCPFSPARMIEVTDQGKVIYETEQTGWPDFPHFVTA